MSRLNSILRNLDDFVSLLFPRLCHACGDHLVRNETIVCTGCMFDIPRTDFHARRDNELEKGFWGRCHIERAAAYAYYTRGGKMQRLIHGMKYSGFREIGSHFGRIYGRVLSDSGFMSGIDAIVPVPLHRSKERARGFNQSEVIAAGISESTGTGLISGNLVRIIRTGTQTRRSRYDRWENVSDVFEIDDPGKFSKMHILLVDDVITTGSTIEGCVAALSPVDGLKVSVAALAAAVLDTI